MEIIGTVIGAAVVTALVLMYLKIRKALNYFKERNIPYVRSKYFIGSDPPGVLLRRQMGLSWDKIYQEARKEKVAGFYQLLQPFIMTIHPDIVHEVLVTSFDHFVDRNFHVNSEKNPLDGNLFFLKGNRWRYLRRNLNPIFTAGKLKWMQEEIDKCGKPFLEHIEQVSDGRDLDLLDLLVRYTIDVIGSCAFGLEPKGVKDPASSMLRKIGKELVNSGSKFMVFFLLQFSVPGLLPMLNIKSTPKWIEDFFCSTTSQALEHRIQTGDPRKDFIQLLVQLKQKGVAEIELDEIKNGVKTEKLELTDNVLAAQSFLFFVAGFETTSKTFYFLFYLLAKHQDVQEKLRKEILDVKAKYGDYTTEGLKEMTYLEKCISETLRIYPVVSMLSRECVKEFTLPDGTVIEKGMFIAIPLLSIQRDPRNFPEPLKFDPERFDNPPRKGTYAPFGDGPRVCIGKKFALTEIKLLISRLLERYRFEKSPANVEPLELDPIAPVLIPKHGLIVRITKLNEYK